MLKPEPVLVTDLFPEERAHLLSLLSTLTDEEWALPTVCPGWSVKDIALHLLGDDVGILSRQRDSFRLAGPDIGSFADLVAYINHLNGVWLEAARRLSPLLLCQLLGFTGDLAYQHFRAIDLFGGTSLVTWAGPEPVPMWLDVAREYTERWVHQQQIRDAVGRPGLKERRFFAPVLAAFVWALPRAFAATTAPAGTAVDVVITGDAGGRWTLVREWDRWGLYQGMAQAAAAQVVLDQEVAWRLFTKGISPDDAREQIQIEGDEALGLNVLAAVAILA